MRSTSLALLVLTAKPPRHRQSVLHREGLKLLLHVVVVRVFLLQLKQRARVLSGRCRLPRSRLRHWNSRLHLLLCRHQRCRLRLNLLSAALPPPAQLHRRWWDPRNLFVSALQFFPSPRSKVEKPCALGVPSSSSLSELHFLPAPTPSQLPLPHSLRLQWCRPSLLVGGWYDVGSVPP